MRRQARRMRRYGMQPMVVINSDDQLPDLFIVLATRFAWRHRSAFVPFIVTATAFTVSAIGHHDHPGWWIPFLSATITGTILLGIPNAIFREWQAGRAILKIVASGWQKCGLDRPTERAYAAILTVAIGGWTTTGIVIGPATKPLPAIAVTGTLILGVPWWIHRRRRAKVRVERTVHAWPEIADNIGLPGSRIMSVVVDAWGWTARVALRKGTTSGHAIGHLADIESGLGIRPGSARALPDETRADRFILRVIETDPHADPIRWPGPSITSITRPMTIGLFEDGRPVQVMVLRRNMLVGGIMGAGKSGVLNVILGNLTECRDAQIWGIDLKGGMELGPWARSLYRLATTPAEAITLLKDAIAELNKRAAFMAAHEKRLWEPTPTKPAIVIVIDEYAELPDEAQDCADSIARRGRAVAVNLLAATQRPTQDAMGNNAVRSQMDLRICLRVRERRDVDLILGQGAYSAGWHAHTLTLPGTFLISAPEHTIPQPARAYLITDQQVTDHTRTHTPQPEPLSAPQSDQEPPDPTPVPTGPPDGPDDAQSALMAALRAAGPDGAGIADLLATTGLSRPTLYRHLHAHVKAGRAVQTRRGHWRATGDPQ